jgi:hypothetical protein
MGRWKIGLYILFAQKVDFQFIFYPKHLDKPINDNKKPKKGTKPKIIPNKKNFSRAQICFLDNLKMKKNT